MFPSTATDESGGFRIQDAWPVAAGKTHAVRLPFGRLTVVARSGGRRSNTFDKSWTGMPNELHLTMGHNWECSVRRHGVGVPAVSVIAVEEGPQ